MEMVNGGIPKQNEEFGMEWEKICIRSLGYLNKNYINTFKD